MMTKEEIRKVVIEELKKLTHSALSGMPDAAGANRDHDTAYHRRNTNFILNDFFLEAKEITAPNTPGTAKARVYLKDSAGTTKLCMKDDAGAETVFGGGGIAGVDSFNTRTGVVVPASNDYTWAQVNKATSSLSNVTTNDVVLQERATQAVAAATTISVTDGSPVTPITSASAITCTAQPFIAAGRDGQLVILRNDNGNSSYTITLRDMNYLGSNTNLRLTADTVAMAAGSSMGLVYSTTNSAWVQQYYTATKYYTGAISTFTVDASTGLTHEWGDGSTANDTAPVFAATYAGIPSAASVTITASPDAGYPLTLLTPFTGGTGAQYFRSATRNGTRTFRISATVNGSALTSDVAVTYRAPNYSGVSAEASNLTSAQVVALTHTLDTDPYATYSSINNTANYIWFAFYEADATLDTNLFFSIGGERAKFNLKDDPVEVTSTYGKVQHYQTYRSNVGSLGASISVVVQPTAPPTRRYYGKVDQGTQLSEAQIEALTSDLTASGNGTFASITSLGAGDYLWLCLPGSISAPTHYGISPGNGSTGYQEAAFTAATVQTVTNQYGYVDAAVKNIHSDVTNFNAIEINNAVTTTWSFKTQAAAFSNRVYMGESTDTDPISTANILTLDDTANGVSLVASTVVGSYVVSITGSNYLWFCHPDAVADLATIKDNSTGFAIAGSYRTPVSHTNEFGFTETYNCWRSDNVNIFPTGGTVVVT